MYVYLFFRHAKCRRVHNRRVHLLEAVAFDSPNSWATSLAIMHGPLLMQAKSVKYENARKKKAHAGTLHEC
jgi:hypothetical protein